MKVRCPYHKDDTASMEIYETHAFCFGCSKKVTHLELEAATGEKVHGYPFRKGGVSAFRENINSTMDYIRSLPTKEIRGFELPFDRMGYYLVWPDSKYYIKRMFREVGGKYKSPAGFKRPLFVPAILTSSEPLFIVEGEFNALAAYKACEGRFNIVSPGAATNFESNDLLELASQFKRIVVIVDRDAAGVLAGVGFKQKMLTRDRRIVIIPVEKDFNDTLLDEGSSKVHEMLEAASKQL